MPGGDNQRTAQPDTQTGKCRDRTETKRGGAGGEIGEGVGRGRGRAGGRPRGSHLVGILFAGCLVTLHVNVPVMIHHQRQPVAQLRQALLTLEQHHLHRQGGGRGGQKLLVRRR